MNDRKYNLDENVAEYFDFVVEGHEYRFRHLTTEELDGFRKVSDDEQKGMEYLYQFISKTHDDSPDFTETAKKMIAPKWVKFRKMILTEMTDGDN